jgi:hypothetical protein
MASANRLRRAFSLLSIGLAGLAVFGATGGSAMASYSAEVTYADLYIYPKVIGVTTNQDASNWCKSKGHGDGKINSAGGVTCW